MSWIHCISWLVGHPLLTQKKLLRLIIWLHKRELVKGRGTSDNDIFHFVSTFRFNTPLAYSEITWQSSPGWTHHWFVVEKTQAVDSDWRVVDVFVAALMLPGFLDNFTMKIYKANYLTLAMNWGQQSLDSPATTKSCNYLALQLPN